MPDTAFPSELFLPFLKAEQSLPQYMVLFRAFQQAILQGDLITGAKLPASRPLAIALNISRNTVKTAYEMLQAEGYIETRHGAGSYVAQHFSHQNSPQKRKQTSANTATPTPILSDLAQRLQALKSSQTPSHGKLFSLALPCLKSFPWQQWQRHVNNAGRKMRHASGDSGVGNAMLRAQVADYLQVSRGVKCDAAQVMICSGSQQALYLALQVLVNPNEPVMVESPGYRGIDGALQSVGARKITVPADQEGFCLEQGLAQAKQSRVALLTPSRNYPMGYTLSLERRLQLIQWASAASDTNRWIIEDDYDSEFRFDGPPLTSLHGLGGEQQVIYIGTFSRILHPSIRLGYMVMPAALVEPFTLAKQYIDGGLSQLPQLALGEFMASGEFSSHVRRMRKLYQQRRDCLSELMEQSFGTRLKRVNSDGGMHSVFLLPEGYSDTNICQQAAAQGLAIKSLSGFYSEIDQPVTQGLVIGFAGFTPEEMARGVETLKAIILNQPPS